MKLVALWAALVVVAVTAAGSCSVNHRSGEFACETTRDCAAGRICNDGLCVSTRPIDAGVTLDTPSPLDAPLPIDAPQAMCPAQCTSCDLDAKTCAVDCGANPILCTHAITCPTGFSCKIDCTSERACRNGIDCADAADCTITCGVSQSCRSVTCGAGACKLDCEGLGSCANVTGGNGPTTARCSGSTSCTDVTCGSGKCVVDCVGPGSCTKADCGNACSCDVSCGNAAGCFAVSCPLRAATDCTDGAGGCSSLPRGCNTCL